METCSSKSCVGTKTIEHIIPMWAWTWHKEKKKMKQEKAKRSPIDDATAMALCFASAYFIGCGHHTEFIAI